MLLGKSILPFYSAPCGLLFIVLGGSDGQRRSITKERAMAASVPFWDLGGHVAMPGLCLKVEEHGGCDQQLRVGNVEG